MSSLCSNMEELCKEYQRELVQRMKTQVEDLVQKQGTNKTIEYIQSENFNKDFSVDNSRVFTPMQFSISQNQQCQWKLVFIISKDIDSIYIKQLFICCLCILLGILFIPVIFIVKNYFYIIYKLT